MMIEKVQRFIGGNTGEPERELGEFDRKGIDVHAIDARFHDSTTPVGDFRPLLRQTFWYGMKTEFAYIFLGSSLFSLFDNLQSHQARRRVGANSAGQFLRRAHQEMAAAHRWIEQIQA